MNPMPSVPRARQTTVFGLLIFLAVLGVYLPAIGNGFVNYDDPDYVILNPHVLGGLTWGGLRWAFRSGYAGNWHPLTWLSHMADCQFYGLIPWGHHLTSVLLHALNAMLLFLVLRQMTGATGRSFMVAALFGLHPLHVESVAWVAERKDVLSTFFLLLTLGAYVKWARPSLPGEAAAGSGNRLFYGLALVCFALGLMGKAMLVTLPFVLLLLDYWPLGRTGANKRLGDKPFHLLIEKIPFLALAAADGAVTLAVQGNVGAVSDSGLLPFGLRIDNALISYCRYLGGLFYPANLAIYYPYPAAWPVAEVLGSGALLVGITVFAVTQRRDRPYLPVGWFWYLGTLLPVIGLVQVGSQSMADRYTYIPSIGIFLSVVWGAEALTRRWRRQAVALGAIATAILAGCALLTCRQIGYWADSETLFRHALAATENNWLAHNNLGSALLQKGDASGAIAECTEALRLSPRNARAHSNLADALMQTGRRAQAIAEYGEALRLAPNDADIHNNLGNALAGADRLPEAITEYEAALRLNPSLAVAYNNLGNALAGVGRFPAAIAQYERALDLRPDYAGAHENLGDALLQAGKKAEAAAEYRKALSLNPDYFEAHCSLGSLLADAGRTAEAVGQLTAAARLQPKNAGAHNNLGSALAELGQVREARLQFEEALRLDPNDAEARTNLARLSALIQEAR